MIYDLQTIYGKNIDATKVASADMLRGTFVTVNELTGVFSPATDTASADGFVTRDVKVDDDVAYGIPVSDVSVSQDTIKKDEFAGVVVPQKGERYATTEFTGVVEAGKYLAVKNGKLEASASNAATSYVSLGAMKVAGHDCLGFKIV